MRLSNLGWTGIVGMCAMLAGLQLLWRYRAEIANWVAAYVAAFRGELSRRASARARAESNGEASFAAGRKSPRGALAIVFALCLILAGQAILFLDLLS
jgi:hypothetical protein